MRSKGRKERHAAHPEHHRTLVWLTERHGTRRPAVPDPPRRARSAATPSNGGSPNTPTAANRCPTLLDKRVTPHVSGTRPR